MPIKGYHVYFLFVTSRKAFDKIAVSTFWVGHASLVFVNAIVWIENTWHGHKQSHASTIYAKRWLYFPYHPFLGCYKLSSKTNQLLNFLNWVWSNNIVSATQFVCDVYHSHYTNMFGTMSKPVYCYQKIWPGQNFIVFPCQINYWNSIPSKKSKYNTFCWYKHKPFREHWKLAMNRNKYRM